MQLRKARDFAQGRVKELDYNPLWKHIYSSAQESLLSQVGDDKYDPSFYVQERVSDDGVTTRDVEKYLQESPHQLLPITGPAGVGKTTFLHHAIGDRLSTSTCEVVWIDVRDEVDETSAEAVAVVDQFKTKLLGELDAVINGGDVQKWWTYFLRCAGKPEAAVLRLELEETGTLGSEGRGTLNELLREARVNPLEMVRLQLGYIRDQLGKVPCVVIDNVDMLPVKAIRKIFHFARLLAGSRKPGRKPRNDHAAVIMALRPITGGLINATTHLVDPRRLRPPVIEKVLMRRLEHFLHNLNRKAVQLDGHIISDHGGGEVDLARIIGQEVKGSAVELVNHIILTLARIMTGQKTPFGLTLSRTLQTLTNENTRLCLLATAQYLASPHIKLPVMLKAFRSGKPAREMQHPSWAFKALLLGIRLIFATAGSWVCNLFDDGVRDATGVMIRLRTLRMISTAGATGGISKAATVQNLCDLFGYEAARVEAGHRKLWELGLLDERAADRFILTGGGELYLTLTRDFDYLQHVLIDACVGNDYLVECRSAHEPFLERFRRVLAFARWLRDLEITELAGVLRSRKHDLYKLYYGRDLVCRALLSALEHTFRDRPRERQQEQQWAGVKEDFVRLRDDTRYEVMEQEAKSINDTLSLARAKS